MSALEIPGSAEFLVAGVERMVERSKGTPRRSLVEFAEAEIVLPDGPHKGERLDLERSPQLRILFELIDRGEYAEHYWSACVQSGKTLALLVTLLYFLFELEENVVFGLPTMEIWADKWYSDILPAITSTKYKRLIPDRGPGARGGRPDEAVRFKNGTILKPMSAGGSDAKRSAFTSRAVFITELDKFDEAGGSSRETDKARQMVARTKSFGDRARVFGECTVTTETGRIWSKITDGSATRLAHRCPKCEGLSILERDHLVGWKDAPSEYLATSRAAFVCPRCGELWSEADRAAACEASLPVHRGQRISDDGSEIVGEAEPTLSLGYRWNASHNLFVPAGSVGAEEWAAARSRRDGKEVDAELAEIELRQYSWVTPIRKGASEEGELTPSHVSARQGPTARGVLPAGVRAVTLGADVQKRAIYWSALGVLSDGSLLVPDYGVIEIHSETTPIETAIPAAIEELEAYIADRLGGWRVGPEGDRRLLPCMSVIDSNYMKGPVLRGVRAINRTRAARAAIGSRGRGHNQFADGRPARQYRNPTKSTKTRTAIGEAWHIDREVDAAQSVVEVNADHWKSFVHGRLRIPPDAPGAMVLFDGDQRNTHQSYAHHLTAEQSVEDFVDGKPVRKFVQKRAANHYLDACALSCVAASIVGLVGTRPARGWGDPSQIIEGVSDAEKTASRGPASPSRPRRPKSAAPRITGPGGAPFLLSERR